MNNTNCEEIQNLIQSGKKVIILCSSKTCEPCKKMKKSLESLEGKYPEITFVTADVENTHAFTIRYRIRSVPTLLTFNEGKFVGMNVGNINKQLLEMYIQG